MTELSTNTDFPNVTLEPITALQTSFWRIENSFKSLTSSPCMEYNAASRKKHKSHEKSGRRRQRSKHQESKLNTNNNENEILFHQEMITHGVDQKDEKNSVKKNKPPNADLTSMLSNNKDNMNTIFGLPEKENNIKYIPNEIREIPKPPVLKVPFNSPRSSSYNFKSLFEENPKFLKMETSKGENNNNHKSLEDENLFQSHFFGSSNYQSLQTRNNSIELPVFAQGKNDNISNISNNNNNNIVAEMEVKRLRKLYQDEMEKSSQLISMLIKAQDRINLYEEIVSDKLLTQNLKTSFHSGKSTSSKTSSTNNNRMSKMDWWMLLPFFPNLVYEHRDNNDILRDVAKLLAIQRQQWGQIQNNKLKTPPLDRIGISNFVQHDINQSRRQLFPNVFYVEENEKEEREEDDDDDGGSFSRVLVPIELRNSALNGDTKNLTTTTTG